MAWIPLVASSVAQAAANSNTGATPSSAGTVSGPETPIASNPNNARNNINIAPVAVNLGEILGPYIQSGPENGGSGVEIPSPMARGGSAYAPQVTRKAANPVATSQPYVTNTGVVEDGASATTPVVLIGVVLAGFALAAVIYKATHS